MKIKFIQVSITKQLSKQKVVTLTNFRVLLSSMSFDSNKTLLKLY